ncbi:formylglycine-generating enzyme family protein [Insolitispirillum peregrinum]|uniref:formylglycine-generating enzyme family protein n=1 Tax=Insolitispirillum peregrinum TaxID=80876 RepID=UPI00360A089C
MTQLKRCLLVLALLLVPLLAGMSAAQAVDAIEDCAECPPLVPIPAGVLIPDDAPPRPIAAFLMGQTEVTFSQWQACVNAHACKGGQSDHGWGSGSRPIININYTEALEYVNWLNRITKRTYRIPNEDEWEWAARGGTHTLFWWGNDPGEGNANCRACGTQWSGRMTAPVGSFNPNPYGLYDTAGNVWEWTSSCWNIKRAAPPAEQDCQQRAARGGAWYYIPLQSRSNARARHPITLWSYTVGFRVAAELETHP